MKKILCLVLSFLIFGLAYSAPPTRTDTYVSQTTIDPSAVTRNEDSIFTYLQAGVDTLANNSVTSANIVDDTIVSADISDYTIVNADVNSSAGIVYSKLTFSDNIVAGDIATNAVGTTEILDATITTTDISGTAGITDAQIVDGLTIDGGTVDNSIIGDVTPAQATVTILEVNTSIKLTNTITEFSTDDTLAGDSDSAIPTEQAVKGYVDTAVTAGQSIKAWVNFNGAGTAAIRDSFNVSSLDDDGTGDYGVNWTTNFADTNYCVTLGVGDTGGVGRFINVDAYNVGSVDVVVTTGASTVEDADFVNIMAIGAQ